MRAIRSMERGIIAVVALLLAACDAPGEEGASRPHLRELTVAVAEQPVSAALWVAQDHGLFAAEGLPVRFVSHLTGRQALAAVLAGEGDLATTAETPVVHAVLAGREVAVLATMARTREGFAVLARRGRGIEEPADLRGRRVGVTPGTNAEYFLDLFGAFHRIPDTALTRVATPPHRLVPALRQGSVDAVVSWEPHTRALGAALGDSLARLPTPPVYTWFWNVAIPGELAATASAELEAFLRALRQATSEIRADPAGSRRLVEERLGLPDSSLDPSWDATTLEVTLSQELLLTMEEQARWVLEREGEGAEVPDFLDAVAAGPLRRVSPAAVSIIGAGGGSR